MRSAPICRAVVEQLIEFHVIVAKRARNRRASREIILHKRPHHRFLELLLEIHHVVGNAQMFGHAARVVHIVDRTAAVSALELRRPASPGKRRWFHSCIVRPTIVCPRSRNIAATVELSTPPLIATATVLSIVAARSASD